MVKENWTVFIDKCSKSGNGDSVRPIAEELRRLRPDMKFFFYSKRRRQIDMADEVITRRSLRAWWVLRNAKYVVTTHDFPKMKKQKGQVFVQTWHGTPLKKIGPLRYASKKLQDIKFKKYIERPADIFCASGKFSRKVFKEAMPIKDEAFINSGLPRNDILFRQTPELVAEICKKLRVPDNKKVLLYCPTFREFNSAMPQPLDLKMLKEKFGDEYILLIRSHATVRGLTDTTGIDGEFCFDVTGYENISELYLAADVLIGDYSSTVFDFANTGKPQIFYAYDLEKYASEWGMYFDYEDFCPGPIVKTNEELAVAIADIGGFEARFGEKYKAFREEFCTYETGVAAKQVVEAMLKK